MIYSKYMGQSIAIGKFIQQQPGTHWDTHCSLQCVQVVPGKNIYNIQSDISAGIKNVGECPQLVAGLSGTRDKKFWVVGIVIRAHKSVWRSQTWPSSLSHHKVWRVASWQHQLYLALKRTESFRSSIGKSRNVSFRCVWNCSQPTAYRKWTLCQA